MFREQCLELVKFCSEFEVCTSDHKPVYAVFRLSVPRPLRDRSAEYDAIANQQLQRQNIYSSRYVAMKLVSLNVEDLDASLTVLTCAVDSVDLFIPFVCTSCLSSLVENTLKGT